MWEARVKRHDVLDALNLLGAQENVQRADVLLQLFNLSASDYREHVGEPLEMVRDRNCLSVRDFRQGLCRTPVWSHLLDVILSVPTSLPISSRTSHTLFCSGVRSHSATTSVRPFSPLSLRRASSAFVRIFPAARTPQGASASPSERAIGMMSRSNDRLKIDQLPW